MATSNRKKSASGTRKPRAKKGSRRRSGKTTDRNIMQREILLGILLLLSVLFLLSFFTGNGLFLNRFRSFQFGLFGIFAMAFPFWLAVSSAFILSNPGRWKIYSYSLMAFFVIWMFCGLTTCFTASRDSMRESFGYFYKLSSVGKGGGVLGALFWKALAPYIGRVGTILVLFAILIFSVLLFFEKSLLAFFNKISLSSDHFENEKQRAAYEKEQQSLREKEANIRAERLRTQRLAKAERRIERLELKHKKEEEELMRERMARMERKRELERVHRGVAFVNLRDEGPNWSPETEALLRGDEPPVPYVPDKKPVDKEFHPKVLEIPIQGLSSGHEAESEYTTPEQEHPSNSGPSYSAYRAHKEVPGEPGSEDLTHPLGMTKAEAAPVYRSVQRSEEERKTEDITFEIPEEDVFTEEKEEILFPAAETHVDESNLPPIEEQYSEETEDEILPFEKDPFAEFSSPEGTPGAYKREDTKITIPEGRQVLRGSDEPELSMNEEPKKEYVFPPLDLLSYGKKSNQGNMDRELRQTAEKLRQTLQNFGVGVTVTNISCGPTVTRYELQPEQGIKVSRIVNLADDIKLNLAAQDIRIEAPIPGKAAIGIEVPNTENSVVKLREILESKEFKDHPSKLAFAVGKDIGGQNVVSTIAKMPHVLIAGATGSGKSVCINSLIMSILYKAKPTEVKLIMIDPKVVELSVYNGIPHLLMPVVTDPRLAAGALNWGVKEMTDRYKSFAEYNVRDVKSYNETMKRKVEAGEIEEYRPMSEIVIIVDELADLMMVAPGEVEEAICRLAQMARAAGIHLVLATQRPSVNVITGLIKANVPSRIAFAVSSGIDSRTIIDMNGAEKLLGKGDMLFHPYSKPKPIRVQGAFVSDEEVKRVVDFVTTQENVVGGDRLVQNIDTLQPSESMEVPSDEERDEYFERAAEVIIDKDKASIGMLQRVFRIGFNRAARIMDQLYEFGLVGEEEGTKPRKILMTAEEFHAALGQGTGSEEGVEE